MNSLSGYTEVLRKRKDALVYVQAVSNELLGKLAEGNWQDLNEILDRREHACVVLTNAMAGCPEMPEVIEKAQSGGCEDTAQSILGLDEDIRVLLADVVEKQQRCEELLKAEIKKTAELIRQSAAKRSLNSAYGPANARPQARFLDGKH